MSIINIRDWEIWTNYRIFKNDENYQGYYECSIAPTLMAHQTVEFLAEKFEIRRDNIINVSEPPIDIIKSSTTSEEGMLAIRIYDTYNSAIAVEENIADILKCINSISLCVDFSFICQKIRFISNDHGKLFIANRMRIGRGMAFEIEERGQSSKKLQSDYIFYKNSMDDYLEAATRHYLTGLKLLSLEDEVSGLIDAAFMQFYQACELLCMDSAGRLKQSKIYIASLNAPDGRELQIIAHHIWRVRNKYFGHGDLDYNVLANTNIESAIKVAKQVYVARYLCKKLIDLKSPSKEVLLREMMFFSGGANSGNFRGTINELETNFKVDFDRRKSDIFSSTGAKIEEYEIS